MTDIDTILISPEQQAIIDRMITNCDKALATAKGVVKKNILQAAEDLEKTGAPLTSICHMIVQRVEQKSKQFSASTAYVYEVLPDKYKDPVQRAAAMAKYNDPGEIAAEMAKTDAGYGKPSQHKKTVRVTKKKDIKLIRRELKDLRKENEDLKKSPESFETEFEMWLPWNKSRDCKCVIKVQVIISERKIKPLSFTMVDYRKKGVLKKGEGV